MHASFIIQSNRRLVDEDISRIQIEILTRFGTIDSYESIDLELELGRLRQKFEDNVQTIFSQPDLQTRFIVKRKKEKKKKKNKTTEYQNCI